jgi:RNA polymerase sigma-70 factor (ECF subfamily)
MGMGVHFQSFQVDDPASISILYDELKRIARIHLARERSNHTLQPTALVHEAYLRFQGHSQSFEDRERFLATASMIMRQVLIDHARGRGRQKRGGTQIRVTLDECAAQDVPNLDLLILDQGLRELEAMDARQARIVEMRLFAGLTVEEIASVLDISPRTVKRDWMMARAWLQRRLRGWQQ